MNRRSLIAVAGGLLVVAALVVALVVGLGGAAKTESAAAAGAWQGTLKPAPDRDAGLSAASLAPLPVFFSPSSPWNTAVEAADVDPRSRELLRRVSVRRGVVEGADGKLSTQNRRVRAGLYVNTTRWTTPIVTGAGGRETKVFCRQTDCRASADLRTLSVPRDVDPDPSYDGWFTVIDRRTNTAWDLWRARRQADGAISYQYAKRWDLSGPGYGAPGTVSARGSGLPLFAGVITHQEAQRHEIDHALAISLPGPAAHRYVQPASATDGVGDEASLPEGARIRLKPGVRIDPPKGTSRAMAAAIARALRRYGAIVVDRSAVPTLYAQKDVTKDLIRGDELQGVHLDDFEVLRLGRRHAYPPIAATKAGG
jgi:hypothetical protein